MSQEEIDSVLQSFEGLKMELEKKIKGMDKIEPLPEKKIRKDSHRIILKVIEKQMDRMNTDMNEGNITRAQSRKTFIESLISMLKQN
jgi:hypothetical protein